ncbi:MAG TPA: phosphate acyltransferase PlsX [Syntrophorhabdales bacterium]|nr:phosphate acyltransferase PlsX [Syntrophorhabdales bacterium]
MIRIAVDAMGGDNAPYAIVKGAEAAWREQIAQPVLVGDEKSVRPLLDPASRIEVVHTPSFVEMHESPSSALRKKRDSSINKAYALQRSGDVEAVVSAGNSGAAMAFAIFTLGRIPGVERPAIMSFHPNVKGTLSVLLDAGGNVDCKPSHLVQFAIMGHVYAKYGMGREKPRVGLLSNGEEETKGNDLTREAHALLRGVNINYVGYVEGTDMYNGSTDVVVSDGFVGNVALKISEGIAEAITSFLKERIVKSYRRKLGYFLLSDVFKELARTVDYSEYGGAPLVGVNGASIICHGKSNEKAIKNAIAMARDFAAKKISTHLSDAMREYIDSRGQARGNA